MAAEQTEKTPDQYFKGIVKSALDGGCVVIRGPPRNGPPAERVLALTNVDAPRLGRRQTASGAPATEDEPYAWEAREFLRKLVVGKSVLFRVVNQATTREYGVLMIGDNPTSAQDVTLTMVDEGLVKCRDNCQDEPLLSAQEKAKTGKKGVWSDDASSHVRKITWDVENTRELVDRYKGKRITGIVEHVRDGSTLRIMLVPDYIQITLQLSGVRCPSTRLGPDGKPDPKLAEPFSTEAHYFTESRLLQREVDVILESSNNNNFVGSVLHPNGNIAEALLKEGFAKCVDWSITKVTSGPEGYRAAEKTAKERKVRLWKNYEAPVSTLSDKDREFTGKVVEIVNGDALMVKVGNTYKKIHLASIKAPKLEDKDESGNRIRQKGFRPLYDIPFMFDAREFLRKKVIGHSVQVKIDYVQPARPAQGGDSDFPEKTCCTVIIGGVNIAEALVAKGLATVVRYAADNDQRSSRYDELMQAEDHAIKSSKGLHSKNKPTHKVNDMTGNLVKCKTFFPSLQRHGKLTGIVEFVASGSRFRVYIPRETCVLTFLLGGITCQRSTRNMPSGDVTKGEPFGDECLLAVKEMTMQREVEIEVESMDKAGNFIGYMWVDGMNLSVHLVQEGFASMHFTADKSQYGNMIKNAEDNSKAAKRRIWENYAGEEEHETVEEADRKSMNEERKVSYEQILVSEVTEEGRIYGCSVKDGPALEKLMDNLREEFRNTPPLAGSFVPKRNELCAAKFVDNQWYRAKVEKMSGKDIEVLYVDYGNRATVPKTKIAALPATLQQASPFARLYNLALVSLPDEEEYRSMGIEELKADLLDQTLNMNVEYRMGTDTYVTLYTLEKKMDVGKALVEDGLLLVDRKAGRKLADMQKDYNEAMEKAKKAHLNIWRYGDITADDAKEFGHK